MADKFDLKAIISAVDKITPTLKGIQRSVKLTSKTIKDIGSAGRSLTTNLGIPAGLAFSGIAYGAVRATRAALEYGGAIQDAAERTGASVEGYQTLGNMLNEVGGSAEDAEMAFTKFNKGIAEAAAGADKNFAGLMKKMRIPLRNAKGELVSLTDVLPDLAQAFVNTKDPATRTRMAMELWGKSGSRMIPIMLRGRDGMKAWVKEQERLGAVLGGDAVGALDNLGDSFGFVGTQIRTQWASALAKMVPLVQPLIKQLTEWIAANKELIQTKVVSVVKEVANWVQQTDWQQVARDIRDVARAVADVVHAVGGIKNVLIGIGIAFAAGPISSILSIVGALWRFGAGMLAIVGGWTAVGGAILRVISIGRGLLGLLPLIGRALLLVSRALLMNPIGLALTAIAAAAYLVYANWDKIKGWFIEFFNWLPAQIRNVGKWFSGLVPDWARNLFGGNVTLNQQVAKSPLQQSGALQMAGGRQQLTGDMTVRFENAPPGMRVSPGKTNQSGLSFNPDVGYRSLGFGR